MSGIDLRWCFWAWLAWLWPFTWLAAAAEAATPVDGQKQPRSLVWADFAFFLPALVPHTSPGLVDVWALLAWLYGYFSGRLRRDDWQGRGSNPLPFASEISAWLWQRLSQAAAGPPWRGGSYTHTRRPRHARETWPGPEMQNQRRWAI